MKAYFGSNQRNYVFKRRKRILNLIEVFYTFWKRKCILNLPERNYAFRIGKRILEVRHGLQDILRETTGALLQINLAKGYGDLGLLDWIWTAQIRKEGGESPAGEENRCGGAPLPAARSSPERLVWALEATVWWAKSTGNKRRRWRTHQGLLAVDGGSMASGSAAATATARHRRKI